MITADDTRRSRAGRVAGPAVLADPDDAGPKPLPDLVARRYREARQVVLAHSSITDAVFAVLVGIVSTPWLLTTDPDATSWFLQLGLLVPLVWRRRYPCGVFVAVCAVALVQWLVGIQLVADLSLLVALSTVATYRPRQLGLAAVAVIEVGAVMAATRWSLAGTWLRSLVCLTGLVAAGWLLGTNLRGRRALVVSLTQRADRLERERDQQARLAAAAERNRIAREMHDVIGHSLAVMVSLADGASAKLATDPARCAGAIANVAEIGRQALGETRLLLGVLRTDDGDGLAPQPDLARLADLVAQTRATGLDVTLDCEGDLTGLGAGVELTIYRVVQEAITNTLKHAVAPTTVVIRVATGASGVTIDVTDDGRPDDGRSGLGRPGSIRPGSIRPGSIRPGSIRPGSIHAHGRRPEHLRTQASIGTPGRDGHGLTGMRERVAVYGGSVTAGPSDNLWAVRVHLPSGP